MGVLDTCDATGAASGDQLMILQLAWLTLAGRVRSEAIAVGRFQAEQAEQLRHLDKMKSMAAADTPDMELERLHQEGDYAGVAEYLRRLAGEQ
jgi:hypothetical protein